MNARPITTIALVQAFMVVLCFTLMGLALKIQTYPSEDLNWRPFTVFLRSYGMWMLLIPVAWTIFCVIGEKKWQMQYADILAMGIVVVMGIFVMFLWAAVDSHTRPIYLRISKPAPPTQPEKVPKRFEIKP